MRKATRDLRIRSPGLFLFIYYQFNLIGCSTRSTQTPEQPHCYLSYHKGGRRPTYITTYVSTIHTYIRGTLHMKKNQKNQKLVFVQQQPLNLFNSHLHVRILHNSQEHDIIVYLCIHACKCANSFFFFNFNYPVATATSYDEERSYI